jgi:Acyl-CoA dehydrogenase, C-terminal domain
VDAAEVELIRTLMRHLVTSFPAADIAAELVESGWDALLATDTHTAVDVLAEEIGKAVVAAPVLELVLLHGLGLGIDATTAVVLPPLSRGSAAGWSGTRDGAIVDVDGLVLAGHQRAERVLVATADGVVAVRATDLTFRPTGAGDPALDLHRVCGRVPTSVPVANVERWNEALTLARRALAAELIGLASQMLEDTITYVVQREQFGRAIASFQSVKHRLADVSVAITAARRGLVAAWSDTTALSAMAALCLAVRAEHLAATHCHQVHGGIAFTVEHGFHRFIRRGQVISGLLGNPDELVRDIGARLIADRAVPRTPRLR